MLLITRAVLRRRWPALVALGVVAGLTGATVTSAVALARRTGTAQERLEVASAPGDVTMFVAAGDEAAQRVTELPGVEAAWVAGFGVGAVGDSTQYIGLLAGPPPPPGLFRPIAVEGRLPDPDAAEEVAIHEVFAGDVRAELGRVIGARVPLHFLTAEDFQAFDTGFGAPDGPAIEVTIVGVVRLAGRPEALFSTVASPAFATAHADALFAPALYIALEDGEAGVPAFLEELDRLERELPPLEEGAQEFGAFEVQATSQARGEIDTTAGVLVTGLMVFAAVAGLAGLLVVAQAFARYHAATAGEQRTESALGLTRAQRAGSRALGAALSGVLAAAIAAIGTVVAGSGDPVGALSTREPNPGRSVNIAVVAGGSAVTALVVVAVAGATAWFAFRFRPAELRRGRDRADRFGGRPIGVAMRFAIGRGGDDAARAARMGLAGLVLGIVGIIGALTFDASLARLVETPARYGWSADFAIADTRPEIDREVLADRRVAEATRYRNSTARVQGRNDTVALVSPQRLRGEAGWWIVDGAEPRTGDEVMLGLRLADELGVGVGDEITLDDPDGSGARAVTVVGTGVEPPIDNHRFGAVILVTPSGFERYAQTEPFTETLVGAVPSADPDALADDYGTRYEISTRALPREVDNLRQLEHLPAVLGGFLAVVGLAALANAVVLAVRRRGRDLAVLRVVGYTPGQTAVAVVTMALVAGVISLGVGVPLGIAAGRLLWQLVARGISVEGDALVPGLRTLAVSTGVLVAALLAAALPARRAATLRPSTLLRAE